MSNRWSVVQDRLEWKTWDGEQYVIFNRASGDTHLLNRVSAQVLLRFAEGPQREDDLKLSGELVSDRGGSSLTDTQLKSLIAQFYELGLIEPIL